MDEKLKDELLNSIADIIHNLSIIIYKIEKTFPQTQALTPSFVGDSSDDTDE